MVFAYDTESALVATVMLVNSDRERPLAMASCTRRSTLARLSRRTESPAVARLSGSLEIVVTSKL